MVKGFVFGILMATLSCCMYSEGMPMSSVAIILIGAFIIVDKINSKSNSKQ